MQKFSNAGVIKFSNPLDMGDIYDPQLMAHVIFSVMHSEQVDGALFISQRPQMPQGDDVFHKMFLSDLSKEAWGSILSSGKPLGVCLFGPARMVQQAKRYVEFPVFNSPEEMINALALQMRYYSRERKPDGDLSPPPEIDREAARRWLEGAGETTGRRSWSCWLLTASPWPHPGWPRKRRRRSGMPKKWEVPACDESGLSRRPAQVRCGRSGGGGGGT